MDTTLLRLDASPRGTRSHRRNAGNPAGATALAEAPAAVAQPARAA